MTRAQIEEQLAIPRITTNYWLNKLKDKQQIIREGSGRNTRYVVCLPESEKPPVEERLKGHNFRQFALGKK